MNFGEHLRNLRLERNLTQQRLARDLDMSQASITAYENGVREPSFAVVKKFADYFRVAPSSMMPFDDAEGEELLRFAAMLQTNEQLSKLFRIVKNFDAKKMEAMITLAETISST